MSALLLVIAVLVFIFIAFHHVILVVIAHLFHPHILGAVLIAGLAVMLLLVLGVGFVRVNQAPPPVMVQAPQVPMMPQMPQVQMPAIPEMPNFQPPIITQTVPNPPGYYNYSEHTAARANDFGPTWSMMFNKFGILLMVLLGIVAIVALVNGGLKANGFFRSGMGALLLLVGGFMVFLVFTKTMRDTRTYENNMAELERHMATPPVVANNSTNSRSTPSGRKSRSVNSTPSEKPLPESDELIGDARDNHPEATGDNSPAVEASSAEKPAATPADAPADSTEKPSSDKAGGKPPAWTSELPQRRGDAYLEVVRAKHFDPNVREDKLNDKLVEIVNRYLDDNLFRQPGVGAQLNFDPQYIRSHCVAAEYGTARAPASEPGDEMFAQLRLDENFRREAMDRYGKLISGGRLEHAGAISLAVLVLLGGLYSYLRLTPAKVQTAGAAIQNAGIENASYAGGSAKTEPVDTVDESSPQAPPARRMHWAVLMVLTVVLGSLLLWFLLAVFWAVGMRATIG